MLLLSNTDVPRPSKVTGVTELELHVQRTRQRVQKLQANDASAAKVDVELHVGDAIYRKESELDEKKDQDHPFDPTNPERYDRILATDCAYHFDTRRKFLGQAFAKLEPGHGRIALADICFDSSALTSWKTRALTFVVQLMPLHNRISKEEYVRQMQSDVGFEDVRCEDITEEVFPEFIKFLKRQGMLWWIFASVLQVYTSCGARFVVVSGQRPASR